MRETLNQLISKHGREIPLSAISDLYFGMSPDKAAELATRMRLPVPAYRVGTRRSPYFVRADDLAALMDKQYSQQRDKWLIAQPFDDGVIETPINES